MPTHIFSPANLITAINYLGYILAIGGVDRKLARVRVPAATHQLVKNQPRS